MAYANSLSKVDILNSSALRVPSATPAGPSTDISAASPGRSLLLPASQADPADVTDIVIAGLKNDDFPTLGYWGGSWWYWSAGRYTEIAEQEVRGRVTTAFKQKWSGVRSRHVTDVMEHLKAELALKPGVAPPTWLDANLDWNPAECVPTRDYIVHLPSLIEGQEPSVVPATPRLFTTVATEFGFNPNAPKPERWLQFLDELWGNDEDSKDTLQEIFGYSLTSDTRHQKIFCLIGPKRGGKGTIARVLRKLIGEGNVAGPTLSGLATNFGLESLLGKTLAIVSDMRLGQVDRAVVVERLLAISGEDKLTVDRKHKAALHLQLPTKFLLISNELPRLDDASATIISRMIVLKTTASFYGSEDLNLEQRLAEELPGILVWAIKGWQRLRERGRFEQPEAGRELIEEMTGLASPIAAFVNECCVVDAKASVVIDDLYQTFCGWSGSNGWDRNYTKQRFGRDLRAVVPDLRDVRPMAKTSGLRPRYYYGIGLRPGVEPEMIPF